MSLDIKIRPTKCPMCGLRPEGFSDNVTHNLNQMAQEAGIYQALWRPEEMPSARAGDLAPVIRDGLANMRAYPERYRRHNPENGWGDYEGFVLFVERVLAACEEHPDWVVEADR